jgi:hypothetical protein
MLDNIPHSHDINIMLGSTKILRGLLNEPGNRFGRKVSNGIRIHFYGPGIPTLPGAFLQEPASARADLEDAVEGAIRFELGYGFS